MGWAFTHFVVSSTQYAAIYSGFAILVLFMIWVYVAWLIVLVGASIAFYQQHPEYLTAGPADAPLSTRMAEAMALRVAYQIAARHLQGLDPWEAEKLAKAMAVPTGTLERFLTLLVTGDYLVRTDQEPTRYLLARSPDSIGIVPLLGYVRRFGEPQTDGSLARPQDPVNRIFGELDAAVSRTLADCSLRDLVESGSDAP